MKIRLLLRLLGVLVLCVGASRFADHRVFANDECHDQCDATYTSCNASASSAYDVCENMAWGDETACENLVEFNYEECNYICSGGGGAGCYTSCCNLCDSNRDAGLMQCYNAFMARIESCGNTRDSSYGWCTNSYNACIASCP